MLRPAAIEKPASLSEAYALLQKPGYVAMGGCTAPGMETRSGLIGVELSHLLASRPYQDETAVHIPAMTTLRSLETDPVFRCGPLGILSRSVEHLQGPAFRNMATAGGTVALHLPASELVTALLVLGAEVVLFARGPMPLETYLALPECPDVICEIRIGRMQFASGFSAVRGSDTDTALLCAAACCGADGWRIAVGARPRLAKMLTAPFSEEKPADTAQRLTELLDFGDDGKASAVYRRMICPVVIRRAMEECLL